MSKNWRFWRNVTLIALAHVTLIAGLIRWSVEARNSPRAQSILWLGDVAEASAATEPRTSEPSSEKSSPSPEAGLQRTDEAKSEQPLLATAKSEIELPSSTPNRTPTATPPPKAAPTSTPKPQITPKPIPKAASKKMLVAKATPASLREAAAGTASSKPSPKAKPSPTKSPEKEEQTHSKTEKKKSAKTATAKNGSPTQTGAGKTGSAGKSGQVGGGSGASEFGWYGSMLHDRFYSAWIQPTTTVATGTKISTLVKVRIEKDGRVSKFEIIKPSENVVVNESVAAIAKRVTEVDAPPTGLDNGDHYDVKINFELNTDTAGE